MDYERLWKTLEALMVELTTKGVLVPQELVNDLKSTKTLISIFKTEPSALDVATNIELYLGKIEPNLLYLAESDVGREYANRWVEKISSARIDETGKPTGAPTTFVSGRIAGEHWIRLKPAGLISDNKLKELLTQLNLSSAMQENGYLLIRGTQENIRAFVKEVGKKVGKKDSP